MPPKWLYRLPAAIAIYLLVLPVWWYTLPLLAGVSAFLSELIYRVFDSTMTIEAAGREINFLIRLPLASDFGAQEHRDGLRLDTVTYGLPMLAALVLVTRADSWRAKARALVVGLSIMVTLTVPVVMMWAKLTSLDLDVKITQANLAQAGDRTSFFYFAAQGYAFSQPVVAVLVWLGLLALGTFKARARELVARPSTSRNAPCPCGSGRKYKRCCGRA